MEPISLDRNEKNLIVHDPKLETVQKMYLPILGRAENEIKNSELEHCRKSAIKIVVTFNRH